jgi:hypothetical protein
MTPNAQERRARNRAASDVLRDAYGKLPEVTRKVLKTEYAAERARNDAISWARYLTVVLPRLVVAKHLT